MSNATLNDNEIAVLVYYADGAPNEWEMARTLSAQLFIGKVALYTPKLVADGYLTYGTSRKPYKLTRKGKAAIAGR